MLFAKGVHQSICMNRAMIEMNIARWVDGAKKARIFGEIIVEL
jgi:hypothetical protein